MAGSRAGNSSTRLRKTIPANYSISDKTLAAAYDAVMADTKRAMKILAATSHPIRLRILRVLSVKELCVCVFVGLMRQKYSKISYHLKLLKAAGLVASDKEGNFLIYRLTDLGKEVLKGIEP